MKILLTFFVLFFSSSGFAEWILVSGVNDKNYSIDFNTIQKKSGFAEFWNMENYLNGLAGENNVMSSINFISTDCNSNKIKYLYSFYFSNKNGKGKIIDTYLIPDDTWTTFDKGTHFGQMNLEACK